ncbi:MAG TPA: Arm DNA-binding domain-containing protein [Bacteroidia bacterium]
MISLKLTPDKRRMKQDNTYPLIFRINFKGKTRDISTGYTTKFSDWSTKTNFIKETHPDFKVVAPRVNELRLQYLAKIAEYEKANQRINLQEAKDFIISVPKKQVTVYSFWQTEIEQLYRANRNGGAQVYKEALIAVNKVKSLEISFEKLDYNFISVVNFK